MGDRYDQIDAYACRDTIQPCYVGCGLGTSGIGGWDSLTVVSRASICSMSWCAVDWPGVLRQRASEATRPHCSISTSPSTSHHRAIAARVLSSSGLGEHKRRGTRDSLKQKGLVGWVSTAYVVRGQSGGPCPARLVVRGWRASGIRWAPASCFPGFGPCTMYYVVRLRPVVAGRWREDLIPECWL